MSDRLDLTIPWAALASSNLRNKRRGGRAHDERYKTSRQAVKMIAMGSVIDRPMFAGDVRVKVRYYPPDYRRRDVHNFGKAILDGMQAVVYDDDFSVVDFSQLREDVDEDNPRAEVSVKEAA